MMEKNEKQCKERHPILIWFLLYEFFVRVYSNASSILINLWNYINGKFNFNDLVSSAHSTLMSNGDFFWISINIWFGTLILRVLYQLSNLILLHL